MATLFPDSPNYDFKENGNAASIANLLATASQRNTENQLALQQQQEKQQNDTLQHTMDVTKFATEMTNNMMAQQAQRQMLQGQAQLKSILPPQQQSLFSANPAEATKLIQEHTFKPPVPTYQSKDGMIKQPDGTLTPVRYVESTHEGIPRDLTPQHNPIQGEIVPTPSVFNQDVNLTDADRKNPDLIKMGNAIATGHVTPAQIANLRTANGQKAVKMAMEANPNLDLTKVTQRARLRTDYTPGGKVGTGIQAFNTAVVHSAEVEKSLDGLDNTQLVKWNSVKNAIANQAGHPELKSFNAARNIFANEMAKAAMGGTGIITQAERDQQLAEFDSASSVEQMKGVVDKTVRMMAQKLQISKQPWVAEFGDEKPPTPFVNGRAAVILKRHGIDPETLDTGVEPAKAGGIDLSKFWKR